MQLYVHPGTGQKGEGSPLIVEWRGNGDQQTSLTRRRIQFSLKPEDFAFARDEAAVRKFLQKGSLGALLCIQTGNVQKAQFFHRDHDIYPKNIGAD